MLRDGPETPRLAACNSSGVIITSEQSVYSILGGRGGFSMMGEVRFSPDGYSKNRVAQV